MDYGGSIIDFLAVVHGVRLKFRALYFTDFYISDIWTIIIVVDEVQKLIDIKVIGVVCRTSLV